MVTSIAVRRGGTDDLLARLDELAPGELSTSAGDRWQAPSSAELRAAQREADRIITLTVRMPASPIR